MSNNESGEGQVIYQIYPRSFYDSNGDGIGDLKGIAEKLAYVASLGVDYVWISPFFTSPMKDFGYDVSDYCDVDPIFGSLDDFKEIIKIAQRLGLKVMIDMVLSHSSDQHPWFLKSSQDKTNSKADWYVWVDAEDPKRPPNNWLSVFGNSSWEYNAQRNQFYLHNFLKEQPDLNFHNPEVQTALLEVCKFWLELGVKGMRLDTVNFYFHDTKLRDNPVLEKLPSATDAPTCNPYIFQEHIYDKSRPENIGFLKKLRQLADRYDCLLLGEVGAATESLGIIKEYTAGNDKLHLAYSFDYIGGPFDPEYYQKTVENFWLQAPSSMICNSFGNHDSPRLMSRWPHNQKYDEQFAKLCAALFIFLKGAHCIYQGEELGLTEHQSLTRDEIQDPYGLNFYPEYKGRDGCRTPFVWESNKAHGGFSSAAKTWLPVPDDHIAKAVDTHSSADSLLNFYRQILKFKQTSSALQEGDIKIKVIAENILKITREIKGAAALDGFFNFKDTSFKLGEQSGSLVGPADSSQSGDELGPYGFIFKQRA